MVCFLNNMHSLIIYDKIKNKDKWIKNVHDKVNWSCWSRLLKKKDWRNTVSTLEKRTSRRNNMFLILCFLILEQHFRCLTVIYSNYDLSSHTQKGMEERRLFLCQMRETDRQRLETEMRTAWFSWNAAGMECVLKSHINIQRTTFPLQHSASGPSQDNHDWMTESDECLAGTGER